LGRVSQFSSFRKAVLLRRHSHSCPHYRSQHHFHLPPNYHPNSTTTTMIRINHPPIPRMTQIIASWLAPFLHLPYFYPRSPLLCPRCFQPQTMVADHLSHHHPYVLPLFGHFRKDLSPRPLLCCRPHHHHPKERSRQRILFFLARLLIFLAYKL
jgi:hypothetical protein